MLNSCTEHYMSSAPLARRPPPTLITDCQAIQRILDPNKPLPTRTGQRLQHWAAILQAYNYKLVHKNADQLGVADALSRLPSPTLVEDVQIHNVKVLVDLPLTSDKIAAETANDPLLQQVFRYVHLGWPPKKRLRDNPAIHVFFKAQDVLSIVNKCLMFSSRVVIPSSLRAQVLATLHEGHPGIVRSKLLARSVVWWPSLQEDLTQLSANCTICALVNFKPSQYFVSWPKPSGPFERVHIDFYSKQSLQYFILCDAYSKWLHISYMPSTNASHVIDVLLSIFASFGLPKIIVSDNGPPFDSNEYAAFCTKYNIQLLHSPPYSPEPNGQAEKSVDIAKKGVEKIIMSESKSSDSSLSVSDPLLINSRINKFLFNYRNTPTTSTLKAPNEFLFSFKPRTLLTQLLPQGNVPVSSSHYREGEKVFFRLKERSPVVSATIISVKGPTRYIVSVQGVTKEVHHNQLSRAP